MENSVKEDLYKYLITTIMKLKIEKCKNENSVGLDKEGGSGVLCVLAML